MMDSKQIQDAFNAFSLLEGLSANPKYSAIRKAVEDFITELEAKAAEDNVKAAKVQADKEASDAKAKADKDAAAAKADARAEASRIFPDSSGILETSTVRRPV